MNIIPIFFPILMLLSIANAADMVNITVDDAGPDPSTNRFISYYPIESWKHSSSCTDCTARVDKTRAYQSTWHDGTFDPGLPGKVVSNKTPGQVLYAEFNFTGVAVYVYCILSNSKEFPSGSSDMAFYVDGEQAGTFVRDADGSPGFIYDIPVFSASSLTEGEHRLVIQNGHKNGKKVLLLLDRIVYTQSQKAEVGSNTTSTPPPVGDGKGEEGNQGQQNQGQDGGGTTKLGAIIGGTLGGLGLLLLIGFGWLFWRRQNHRNQNASQRWPTPDVAEHSVHPVRPVHPVSPPVYSEGHGDRYLTGRTITPFTTEMPTTGTRAPNRKELARNNVPQRPSSGL